MILSVYLLNAITVGLRRFLAEFLWPVGSVLRANLYTAELF